jgi:surface-anchored protein
MKKTQTLLLAGLLSASLATTAAQKTVLSNEHADIDVAFEDGAFELLVHDETNDIEHDPSNVILRVNGGARTTVPSDSAYSFLGAAGAPVWILPAVQDPMLLFLGTSGEEIEAGTFQNDTVKLSLKSVKGPGEFSVFAIDAFGVPQVFMNTRNGIGADDWLLVIAGGHTDYNWGFTKAGKYRITVEASGTLVDGTIVSSGDVTYTFRVVRAGSSAGL